MLVERERIQSLSFLSVDPSYSYMYPQAKGMHTHRGLAEEIVPLQPDLIISSSFTKGNTAQILQTLGFHLEKFHSPTRFSEAEDIIVQMGKAVGEPERAQALVAALHTDLRQAKQSLGNAPRQVAISYGPNGFTAGTNTLKQSILDLAGYDNLAHLLGIEYYGNISVEKLLVADPDVIIIDESIPDQNSLAQNYVNHRALAKRYADKSRPSVATKLWLCPGPIAAKAVLSLIEQRLNLPAHSLPSANLYQVPHTDSP